MKKILMLLLVISTLSCTKEKEEEKKNYIIGTVTDIDGNVYNTVKIGNQIWMSENLRVTRYADGSAIPNLEIDDEWDLLGENNLDKGYCLYSTAGDADYSDYGALYSFAAAVNGTPYVDVDVQGVCPDGWHVPNSSEWLTLIDYVGGVMVAGGYLKEAGTEHWERTEKEVTNEYNFNAMPGGNRYLWGGNYDRIGSVGYYWTSSENTNADAKVYWFHNDSEQVFNSLMGKSYGMSIRCVKD